MKYDFKVKMIDKDTALGMIQKYHYSNTLPNLNKIFLGFYLESELCGIVTLGWGSRPVHTIKKIFPSLESKDYFEIGRMCMTEEMPRNSESQMMKALVKWLKCNHKGIKVLFTWADGMVGKPGYVYQASNFLYAGYVGGEFYMKDGIKIHPRQTKSLFGVDGDKRKTIRPTWEQMQENNIQHFRGKQFRYLYFLCDKRETKRLMNESEVDINRKYPKEVDLEWKLKIDNRKWIKSEKPSYITDSKFKNVSYCAQVQ